MFILASASPRRRDLLVQIGASFRVEVSEAEELFEAEDAGGLVLANALAKARAVAAHTGLPVLGADTVVALDGRIFGKPADEREARSMLAALSGRAHEVLTGVAWVTEGREFSTVARTQVFFAPLTEEAIVRYVKTGEPLDKAGAYAVQGRAAVFVERIEGSFSNVVGCRFMTWQSWQKKRGSISMTLLVRDLPEEERPRERLLTAGAASLSNTELLAVLLRTGVKDDSVLHVAEKVLALYKERGLSAITQMSAQELSSIKGVGMAKAATILAAVELGRRLALKAAEQRTVVHGPADAAGYAMPRFRFERKEHFAVLLLNAKNHILALKTISVGTLTSSIAHPREVFQAAIEQAAAAVILVHNHPSGDPTPSAEDLALTRRMTEAGEVMGIPVIDHIILGYDKFISLKEEGMIQ